MDGRMLNLLFAIIAGSASSHIVASSIWDDEECVKFFGGLYFNEVRDDFNFYGGRDLELEGE